MTLNLQHYQDYLVKEKNYASLTVRAYISDILSFYSYLVDFHQNSNLEEVNYVQIRSWIVSLVENNISPTSVNRKISSLKSFYKYLLKTRRDLFCFYEFPRCGQ